MDIAKEIREKCYVKKKDKEIIKYSNDKYNYDKYNYDKSIFQPVKFPIKF